MDRSKPNRHGEGRAQPKENAPASKTANESAQTQSHSSTKPRCGNCELFRLSAPAVKKSTTTYLGQCTREDWPHAVTAGKKPCPQHRPAQPESKRERSLIILGRELAAIDSGGGVLAEELDEAEFIEVMLRWREQKLAANQERRKFVEFRRRLIEVSP